MALSQKGPPEGHVYGRNRFDAHPNYVAYMRSIVEHPRYADMPGAVSPDGRINWQVSSGRSTTFYKHYVARCEWWRDMADDLGLPGKGSDQDRFTIAARTIHPTGYRACRICGQDKSVGYFYLNARFAKNLNKFVGADLFERGLAIDEALDALLAGGFAEQGEELFRSRFPERANAFDEFGFSVTAFQHTIAIRSHWLSPGYMGNPPDRLDGFHDYCLHCRAEHDPGRSPANLRTYAHDRRAFEWWAEGDWGLADALFNSAGPGVCSSCRRPVERVSPDHVGPLACGFKQLPYFVPLCPPCNSSKNRRMSARDVERLLNLEAQTGVSVAGWQIRGLWDAHKDDISTDSQATALSAETRALQDTYLRVLHGLLLAGQARFLRSLLHPEYALYDHVFEGLDPAKLTFTGVRTERADSAGHRSLACRSVRIAFEALRLYAAKDVDARTLRKTFAGVDVDLVAKVLIRARTLPSCDLDDRWNRAVEPGLAAHEAESRIEEILFDETYASASADLASHLQDLFEQAGRTADVRLA